ncbi:hypothetical protein [Umezawaea beigongshangensis]|uniref:hypothetical protein n=1 Tax=Umezawaea beigongshangensis TaxID=2780383 RepID=UPI0018F1176C|nr:hypothetical protein [Umezawaea beigongshangensis]
MFTAAESAAFLQARLALDPTLASGAEELAADLGHLPLALAQAAAYLTDRELSCAAYRRRFADRRRTLAELSTASQSLPAR